MLKGMTDQHWFAPGSLARQYNLIQRSTNLILKVKFSKRAATVNLQPIGDNFNLSRLN